jgi:cell wall-binding repeat protein
VYTFCFKAGKPYVSTKKGNSLFTINAKKYAFSDLGIMQTGRQIVNVANDEIANFCFGEDGIMKTGKQTIFNEETGETENWFFHTDGDKKGQGYHGLRDGILYVYGKRQDATADQRYAPADLNGTTYLVGTAGNVQKASASSTSTAKPELGRGYKDIKDANGTIWTVNTAGVVQ